MGKVCALATALALIACSSGESVDEYNKRQAEIAESKKPRTVVKRVETALPGGVTIDCAELLDTVQLTTLLGEKDQVTLTDKTKKNAGTTAVCSVRRGGEVMDMKKQEEQTKKTMRLGVIAGDELCNVTVQCSIPAQDEQFQLDCKNKIEQGQRISNEAIGTFTCVKVTPKGPNDAFTYQFIDPDSRCVMSVRGGPSVNEEIEVQKCAGAVKDLVGLEQIAAKKQ